VIVYPYYNEWDSEQSIVYQAINLGERSVALNDFSIEICSFKNTLLRMIGCMLINVSPRRGYRISHAIIPGFKALRFGYGYTNIHKELEPGRSYEMEINRKDLFGSLHGYGWEGSSVILRGVFFDETGGTYMCRYANVDVKERKLQLGILTLKNEV
jgi:hypothetical protein